MQKQITQNKQNVQQSVVRGSAKLKESGQKKQHPYLQAQGIIGNHGVLRRYGSNVIQAKLIVGPSNDKYEHEADWMAEQVMRMQEPQVSETAKLPRPAQYTGVVISNLGAPFKDSKDDGRPLPESVRVFFEPRFGYDFSHVRIHRDAQAAEMAQSLNARAFTVGREIVFGAGRYAPDMSSGKRLLAHELTHVIQQRSDGLVQRQAVSQTTSKVNIPEVVKEMKKDLTNHIQNFNIGLNQAVSLFENSAKSELKVETEADRSELWSKFGLVLTTLTLTAIAPMLGLATPLAILMGTASLLMDPALANDIKNANEDKIIEHVKNYFIGSKNSVSSALNNIDKKKTADEAFSFYLYGRRFPMSQAEKNQLLSWFTHYLFEGNVIKNNEVNTSLVNAHAFKRMLRMWHLTTVAKRAQTARSSAGYTGNKWEAVLKKVIQLFPDLYTQWEKIHQKSFEYWFGPSGNSPRAVKINDLTPFQRDVAMVADMLLNCEFGTSRAIRTGSGRWPTHQKIW